MEVDIQQPSQRPSLSVVGPPSTEEGSYLGVLRNPNFLRFFLAQVVSSLGDWLGVIAIAVLASSVGGNAAVGAVMTARVLPGFFVGPLAGVIADRFDRKRTMVMADVARALIIFSLPFFPHIVYLLVASVVLESLTLIWGPAKDASLPHVVKPTELTRANSLSLIAVYGPWPFASVVYAFMSTLGRFLADHVPVLEGLQGSPEALALWLDSLTFVFSAVMIYTLTIPSSRRRAGKLDLAEVRRDLVEGLRFVRDHRQVRPWLIGIALTFTAAGGVFSLGIGFVSEVLGAGDRGFAFLIGFLGAGMIAGLLAVGLLARALHKDVLFSGSLLLLGASLIVLAALGSLSPAIPVASALGFFGGIAYSTGYSLMHETTKDELRGRTFSAAYTVIRIGTLVGLGVFPFVAGLVGSHRIGSYPLPGTRLTLWLAGLVVIGGALQSVNAIRHRTARPRRAHEGLFIAFEGGEGAGKTTQAEAFVAWLRRQGIEVVKTFEPGATAIGRRIREILLDRGAEELDARAEALLYAADRAQHVAEVIRPALAEGRVVVSDRFIDSSLAYQGVARGLGVDEVLRVSEWATGGLLPDLVVFLNVDPDVGLERAGGMPDRIEAEGAGFHARVTQAYLELATRFPDRFIVIDASRPPAEVQRAVIEAYRERVGDHHDSFAAARDLGAPGPVPR